MLNSCAMQHAQTTLGEQSSTYVIPSEAYGKNLRGWRRWLLLFAEYSSLMFSAQVLFDIFFAKRAVISNFSVNWTHDTFFSMFWGAGMALFAVTTRSALSGLEIRSDSIVLYEGEALDPLYQIGRVVPASEIRGVKEVGDVWFIRRGGLIVKYGRGIRGFGARQFYIPSRTPDYSQIKEQLVSMQLQTA